MRVAAVAVWFALSTPTADSDRLVRQGSDHYAAGRYAEAAAAFADAHALTPTWDIAFGWAHAERRVGNCETAIELYESVLRDEGSEVLEDREAQIASYIEECTPEAEPEPLPDPEPDPEPTPPPPELRPEPVPGIADAPPLPRKDVGAGILVGLGGVFVVAGAGLLGASAVLNRDAEARPTHEDFEGAIRTARIQRGTGIAALSLGGALLVGGIIRYAILNRRRNRAGR